MAVNEKNNDNKDDCLFAQSFYCTVFAFQKHHFLHCANHHKLTVQGKLRNCGWLVVYVGDGEALPQLNTIVA